MKLRSIVRIPAGTAPAPEVLESPCDAVLLSVSDADVEQGRAREAAIASIQAIRDANKAAFVRVNHPRTQMLAEDLRELVGPALAGVFLPHTVNPQDARDAAVLLREIELQRDLEPGHTRLFPIIDSARGLLRCEDIVEAAPRVAGLVFDGDGYARDVGGRAEEDGPRMAFARGRIVMAARAFDRLPLVISSGLETRFLAQHGFAGTVIDEPQLAGTANANFTPTASALKRAKRHRDAYAAARAEGAWVARTGSEVADAHSSRKAEQTLAASEEAEG